MSPDSFVVRFACAAAMPRYNFTRFQKTFQHIDNVNTAVHRFHESIAGKPYLIEVAAVAEDRWRAYLVRVPGIPTALMPFYGPTPAEAARLLHEWLTRAHETAQPRRS